MSLPGVSIVRARGAASTVNRSAFLGALMRVFRLKRRSPRGPLSSLQTEKFKIRIAEARRGFKQVVLRVAASTGSIPGVDGIPEARSLARVEATMHIKVVGAPDVQPRGLTRQEAEQVTDKIGAKLLAGFASVPGNLEASIALVPKEGLVEVMEGEGVYGGGIYDGFLVSIALGSNS